MEAMFPYHRMNTAIRLQNEPSFVVLYILLNLIPFGSTPVPDNTVVSAVGTVPGNLFCLGCKRGTYRSGAGVHSAPDAGVVVVGGNSLGAGVDQQDEKTRQLTCRPRHFCYQLAALVKKVSDVRNVRAYHCPACRSLSNAIKKETGSGCSVRPPYIAVPAPRLLWPAMSTVIGLLWRVKPTHDYVASES
jgi:hypothetical protein